MKKMKLQAKIILPMIAIALMFYIHSEKILFSETFLRLQSIRDLKRIQIEAYFENLKWQIFVTKSDPFVKNAYQKFNLPPGGSDENSPADISLEISPVTKRFREIMAYNGWDELMLISLDDRLVCSVKKTADTSANKESEKIQNPLLLSAIAGIREKGGGDIIFSDFALDPLSGGLSGFMIGPLRDSTDAVMGYVAARISPDRLSEIIRQREGLGKTGTSYLMGSDQTIRCAGYPDAPAKDGKAIPAKITVNTESANEALSGKTGQRITPDDKGNGMISAYAPVKAGNLVWALIVEISAKEAVLQLKHIKMLIIMTLLISLIMGLMIALLLSRSIQSEISATMAGMESLSRKEQIEKFEGLMHEASNALEFEKAAFYRDKIRALKGQRLSP